MEDQKGQNGNTEAHDNVSPPTSQKQTRKQRSKANQTPNKPNYGKKKSLYQNWKSLSRTRQLEMILFALGVLGGVGYLIAYIVISASQTRQAQMQHAPLVINSRPPELLQPFTCDPKAGLRTGNMQTFVKNVGNARAVNVNPYVMMTKIVPEQ